MRPVSTGFINASLSPVGFANAYFEVNGTRVDASKLTEITINENLGSSGSFAVGTFTTSEATIQVLTKALPSAIAGAPINIYFGYYVDGAYQYVPMGVYYAQLKDISHHGLFTTITAHDKSWMMTDAYTSSLDWSGTHTVREVLDEIATATGITLGTFAGWDPTDMTVYVAPKGSYRDVIAQMALLTGTNAKLGRTGELNFIQATYGPAVQRYKASNYAPGGYSITSEQTVNYGRVTVNYKSTNSAGEESTTTFHYTAGSGSNTIVVDTVNIRSQAETNKLGLAILGSAGIQYCGYTAHLPGQPQIDLADIISIKDIYGTESKLLVLQATHTFNGAMSSTFSAVVEEPELELDGSNIGGSLTEQVSSLNDATAYARGRAEYAASKADEAAASASRAEASATEAERQAGIATDNANEAIRQAGIATTNANEAKAQADTAKSSADEAVRQAGIATANANEAKQQANTATKYADSALDQLGVVQDVIGVLNWASEHGSFTKTTDTSIQDGKVYFVYDSSTGDYTPVVDPQASALSTYYELTVDEAMESFIMSHLAVTWRGLWVLPNGLGSSTDAQYAPNYKVLLANDGLYVYDGDGVLVSKFGENIRFSSTRQQTIGNNQAYIVFDPEGAGGQGSLTIGGATIYLSGKTLDEILTQDLSVRNFIRNSQNMIYTYYGFDTQTMPDVFIDELGSELTDENNITFVS